jgi:hypothetical protein
VRQGKVLQLSLKACQEKARQTADDIAPRRWRTVAECYR